MFNNGYGDQQSSSASSSTSSTSSYPSAAYPSTDLQFYGGSTSGSTPNTASGYGNTMGMSNNMNMNMGMTPAMPDFSADLGTMGGNNNNSSSSSSTNNSGLSLSGGVDYDNEPPLLEELGINFSEIWSRTLAVSFPFSSNLPSMEENDTDLAGPLCFCLLLGSCLLLTGKVHFGYIYGFGVIGCLLMYVILNLMSDEAISVDRTMSILGYSLLPIVFLAIINIFVDLKGTAGLLLSTVVIGWCTLSATRLFEKALNMKEQRYLVAYPVTMLYACFALLTIF